MKKKQVNKFTFDDFETKIETKSDYNIKKSTLYIGMGFVIFETIIGVVTTFKFLLNLFIN